MAILAVGCNPRFFQLSFVIILMAIRAKTRFQFCGQVLFMTGFALHRLMLAFKRIIGFVMVKRIQPGNLFEGILIMALFAILPEFVLMHILVAIGAVGKGNTRELLKFPAVLIRNLMAFRTVHRLVPAQQRVLCFLVIKTQYRLESIKIMTGGTVGR
jgi:hypothetical protein